MRRRLRLLWTCGAMMGIGLLLSSCSVPVLRQPGRDGGEEPDAGRDAGLADAQLDTSADVPEDAVSDVPEDIEMDSAVDNDDDGSPSGEDCDDTDPNSFPGASEDCNGHDNDCDGTVDEGSTCMGCERAEFESRSFLFCSGRAAWGNAQTNCEGFGYTLASIRNPREDSWASNRARGILNEPWWVGLRQPAGATEPSAGWVWTDDSPLTYTNWSPGQPDGFGSASGEQEDCGHLNRNTAVPDGLWNDNACRAPFAFVCAIP